MNFMSLSCHHHSYVLPCAQRRSPDFTSGGSFNPQGALASGAFMTPLPDAGTKAQQGQRA